MIPLTTKLPAICALLRRVLELEDGDKWHVSNFDPFAVRSSVTTDLICDCEKQSSADWIAFSRNITKPQATALLGDIEAWRELVDTWAPGGVRSLATRRLQCIADAFPDSLFQDSSRCA